MLILRTLVFSCEGYVDIGHMEYGDRRLAGVEYQARRVESLLTLDVDSGDLAFGHFKHLTGFASKKSWSIRSIFE